MKRTVDALIIPYARRRTLELVLSLSGYEADKDGRDPGDNIERIDGQLVEL